MNGLVRTYGRKGPGTGPPVTVPPRVEPGTWAAFAANVVVLDDACHLWMGRLQGNTGYGEFTYRAAANVRRVTGAHRFAYEAFFDLPRVPRRRRRRRAAADANGTLPLFALPEPAARNEVEEELDEPQHVRHLCNEPLCTPVTAQRAATHLLVGDAVDNAMDRESAGRGGRRRFGISRLGSGHPDGIGRTQISEELQAAIRTALDLNLPPAGLVAAIDRVYADGDPYRDQLEMVRLPPSRSIARLRLVQ